MQRPKNELELQFAQVESLDWAGMDTGLIVCVDCGNWLPNDVQSAKRHLLKGCHGHIE